MEGVFFLVLALDFFRSDKDGNHARPDKGIEGFN